nr:immunoglobulin light chain junction region [Macaca mulatta]MOV94823.1 immunoglobulin light chain junction region [Macaca mulatta]MOV94989.1 immunoglobulin light chain junction region [Macaca mulatta]MOV96477.1 immunoglobulin light chain junction region [Macaca mulatta]MOW01860.1 immunoglobulin light chain junction region [Macaca mulatta]
DYYCCSYTIINTFLF